MPVIDRSKLPKTVAEFYKTDPTRWTTKLMAQTADGKPCWYNSPQAVCWCTLGAIQLIYGDATYAADGPVQRLTAHLKLEPNEAIASWNDKTPFDQVLLALQGAEI